jgi:hypothetical protein
MLVRNLEERSATGSRPSNMSAPPLRDLSDLLAQSIRAAVGPNEAPPGPRLAKTTRERRSRPESKRRGKG